MLQILCPHCAQPLLREQSSLLCRQGHRFDIARQGYINLLPVQQKHSLHPGDTRQMVLARRSFLEAGYYRPIAQTLRELLQTHAPTAQTVLDAGCGEGYYLRALRHIPERCGIDISKEAVRFAAARDKEALWLTATAAHLPFAQESFDCLLSMFALTVEAEFLRVLRKGGIFVEVLTGPDHLTALREIIYPQVQRKQKPLQLEKPGFLLLESRCLSFDFQLQTPEAVQSLLYMTPHLWRISSAGAQALQQTASLEEHSQIIFRIYQKIG